jgi:GntR family transcriptional regulator
MLEQEHSVVATLSKEEISAKAADTFIAGKLKVAIGSPVLFRKRFVFDQGERPIEYNLGYYKADSFVYSVESSRQSISIASNIAMGLKFIAIKYIYFYL